jgi:AcrR family transcriptional regulator
MTRKYDSSRRSENAARTRLAIIEAAIKLHGEGILGLNALAEEAGVALPTVNKHFPTREDLLAACSSHLNGTLDFISPDAVTAIADHGERLYTVVRNLYTIHEKTFGQMWLGHKIEAESPIIAGVLAEQEAYIRSLVDAMLHDVPEDNTVAGFARAMLSLLTYRALRLTGGLSYEAAVEQTTQVLAAQLGISARSTA